MTDPTTVQLIESVVGSTRVFSKAVSSVVEDEVLQESGDSRLTPAQVTVMKLIHHSGSRTLSELAALLDVSAAAASKSVDRLVRRNLLSRQEAKSDRRLTDLALTPFGREVLGRYESMKADMLARTFRQFAPEELRTAARVLERLTTALLNSSKKSEEICLQCYMHGDTCSVRQTKMPERCRSLRRVLGPHEILPAQPTAEAAR
jgi:DNA-binding MarR family transcriptional regulator